MDTVEFLQQEWINHGDFMGFSGEPDPIIGLQQEGATFTIPKDQVRRLVDGIETFNVLRGGGRTGRTLIKKNGGSHLRLYALRTL